MTLNDKHLLVHLGIFIAIFILVITLAHSTAATNNTTVNNPINTTQVGNTLNDLSGQAKSINEQIKSIVPYEVWEFTCIALIIVVVFTRGANMGYSSVWKLGIYVAIIAAILWFLLTR